MLFSRKGLPGYARLHRRQPSSLQGDRRRGIRHGQPGQFRVKSACHGLSESTTDVDRPEPIGHDLGGETADRVAIAQDCLCVAAIDEARGLFVEESLNRYVVALLRHTRASSRLALGASPRAGIALLRVAKARALAEGRDYVLPDDVKAVARVVLSHRLILAPEARSAGVTAEEIVGEALEQTPVPV